jgi:hypothetical protein
LAPRRFVVLATVVALVAGALAGQGLAAAGHSGSIESVKLSSKGGFVSNEASFRDVGEGSSRIAVWIEVYKGAAGPLETTLARRSGKGACQAGRTCVTLLRTAVQVLPGECFVGKASMTSEAGTLEQQSPATGRLCP